MDLCVEAEVTLPQAMPPMLSVLPPKLHNHVTHRQGASLKVAYLFLNAATRATMFFLICLKGHFMSH